MHAKISIIYDELPQTVIKRIVSTQTNTTTYGVESMNYYERMVLNAVSAMPLKLEASIRVVKLCKIHFSDQSVQIDINNISFIYWAGPMIDCTVAIH